MERISLRLCAEITAQDGTLNIARTFSSARQGGEALSLERRRGVKTVINVANRLGDAGMGDGMEVHTTDRNLGICLS